jgi:hypothetical protein
MAAGAPRTRMACRDGMDLEIRRRDLKEGPGFLTQTGVEQSVGVLLCMRDAVLQY